MINKQTQTQERLFSFFRANEYNDPGSNFFVSFFILGGKNWKNLFKNEKIPEQIMDLLTSFC